MLLVKVVVQRYQFCCFVNDAYMCIYIYVCVCVLSGNNTGVKKKISILLVRVHYW